ncbi:MAG: hypothetical protein Q8L15_02310 [Methylobacter sp.]|nr:hypothetical protein [Methylobacter sp.]
MSDQKKITPKDPPKQIVLGEDKGLPPMNSMPKMPPVNPPKAK